MSGHYHDGWPSHPLSPRAPRERPSPVPQIAAVVLLLVATACFCAAWLVVCLGGHS